jgi:hypothetical protein
MRRTLTTASFHPSRQACLGVVALCLCLGAAHGQVTAPRVFKPLAPFVVEPALTLTLSVGWTADQTPADFLDEVGDRVKARWRQMYREPPGPPPTTRPIIAYALGGLLADSFLAMQATDSQQFRNNNQDILGYCKVLGLGDKLTPRLMAQGKMAELDEWKDLRQEVVDGHQELCRVLREQRDEDLAVLVDMGVWVRVMDMVSGMVVDSSDPSVWPLCVGSPALLKDLKQRYSQMSEATRHQERIASLGDMLDLLYRHWVNAPPPTLEEVKMTRDHVRDQWAKLK